MKMQGRLGRNLLRDCGERKREAKLEDQVNHHDQIRKRIDRVQMEDLAG